MELVTANSNEVHTECAVEFFTVIVLWVDVYNPRTVNKSVSPDKEFILFLVCSFNIALLPYFVKFSKIVKKVRQQ